MWRGDTELAAMLREMGRGIATRRMVDPFAAAARAKKEKEQAELEREELEWRRLQRQRAEEEYRENRQRRERQDEEEQAMKTYLDRALELEGQSAMDSFDAGGLLVEPDVPVGLGFGIGGMPRLGVDAHLQEDPRMTAVRRQVEAGRGLAKSGASGIAGQMLNDIQGGTIARNKERADREKRLDEENSLREQATRAAEILRGAGILSTEDVESIRQNPRSFDTVVKTAEAIHDRERQTARDRMDAENHARINRPDTDEPKGLKELSGLVSRLSISVNAGEMTPAAAAEIIATQAEMLGVPREQVEPMLMGMNSLAEKGEEALGAGDLQRQIDEVTAKRDAAGKRERGTFDLQLKELQKRQGLQEGRTRAFGQRYVPPQAGGETRVLGGTEGPEAERALEEEIGSLRADRDRGVDIEVDIKMLAKVFGVTPEEIRRRL